MELPVNTGVDNEIVFITTLLALGISLGDYISIMGAPKGPGLLSLLRKLDRDVISECPRRVFRRYQR